MKFKELLKRVQEQPENIRRTILWIIVGVVSIILFFWWIHMARTNVQNFPTESFFEETGVPRFQEEMKEISKIDFPQINLPKLSEEETILLQRALADEDLSEEEQEILEKALIKDLGGDDNFIE